MFLESQDRVLAEKRRGMWRVPTGEQIDNMIHRISYRDSVKAQENVRWFVVAHHILVLRLGTGEQVVKCKARLNI